jgi:hypothetical protein
MTITYPLSLSFYELDVEAVDAGDGWAFVRGRD